jgi:hypothetical protein
MVMLLNIPHKEITTDEHRKVYLNKSGSFNEIRTGQNDLARRISGVFTDLCYQSVNRKKIPIWVADYVLTGLVQEPLWLSRTRHTRL